MLKVVTKVPEIDEIIVIDDGSDDRTEENARSFARVKIHKNPVNQGKAEAVKKGLEMARGDVIMLLDADLSNLSSRDIASLIEPHLKRKEQCVTLSFRGTRWHPFYLVKLDVLSGERVMPRFMLEEAFSKPVHGFLLEVRLNEVMLQHNIPFQSVYWRRVRNTPKHEKLGSIVLGGMIDLKMLSDIMFHSPRMVFDSAKMHFRNLRGII